MVVVNVLKNRDFSGPDVKSPQKHNLLPTPLAEVTSMSNAMYFVTILLLSNIV